MIQVCSSLSDFDMKKRKHNSLIDTLKTYDLKEDLILTENKKFEEIVKVK